MIHIKNPCNANWQEMTPEKSGKFCAACEKVVVDFSKLSDAEIKNYFVTYSNQKTCGRFLESQLNRPLAITVKPNMFRSFFGNNLFSIRSIALLIASFPIWLSSCFRENKPEETSNIIIPDSSKNNPMPNCYGDDSLRIISIDTISKNKNCFRLGETAVRDTVTFLPPRQMLMGDVAVYPEELDTVAVKIPVPIKDSIDIDEQEMLLITGKVMMVDTISQKIKKRK